MNDMENGQCICGSIKGTVMGCPACDPITSPAEEEVKPSEVPTFTTAMLRNEFTCSLCGYPSGKHIVTAYATSPTGLLCPIDSRVAPKYRLPEKKP